MHLAQSKTNTREKFFVAGITIIAALSSLLLIAVVFFMLQESLPIWLDTGGFKFLTGANWRPVAVPPKLGIAPMLVSTMWVALGALLIAAPLGFGCAIFMAEFAPAWLAAVIRPVLNMLTGIPSVVYGFLGAAVLVKFFEVTFDLASGESLFAASLVLAVMVLPFIVANSEAALRAVPAEYRYAGLSLGVSKPYFALHILVPMARKGMLGALVLAFGRAMGETMAVLMLAGNTLLVPTSWFSKGEPLPALIALELGSATPGTLHYQALFAAGLVLVVLVIAVNVIINIILRRTRSGVNSI
ncbi:MAG: phosphate ABC transporter permease subunit PstC [Syntrophomonadaceae bacterium]|nr:phosphate ABC transporter permease subunit PstC [Syntrophomonadaceae bacterium]MDD4549763.1 phosphate ABC transporter permease subunit PstC [Syntrophomonadaceae bacterium]